MDLYDVAVARKLSSGGGGGGGSSDFSTAEVILNVADGNTLIIPMVYDVEGMRALIVSQTSSELSATIVMPLFKGYLIVDAPDVSGTVSTTGGVAYDDGQFTITGDGTITIS